MDFDHILNRKGNGSMKWEDAYIEKRFNLLETSQVYPLFIADMDFRMDEIVKEHLLDYLKEPDLGYFHIQDSFYKSIINWYDEIHRIKIDRDWIIPSLGTITSLHLLCDMLVDGGDVVYFTPVYGPFANCGKLGHPIEVPLIFKEGRYRIDFNTLEDMFKMHNIKILLLCHPHNPGGIMWSKDDLANLIYICKQYGAYLLVDEIHGDLTLDQSFHSVIELMNEEDPVLISASPNKTFNISALSTSFVLSKNKTLLNEYEAYLNRLHLSCNRLGILMIEYVYTYGKDWYKALLNYLRTNITMVIDMLKNTDIEIMRPDSGYLLWMYLPHVKDVDQFVLDLAKETGVLVETGSRFIDSYQGWIRINVATSQTLLKKAIQLLKDFYKY